MTFSISVRESGSALEGHYRKLVAGKWEPLDFSGLDPREFQPDNLEASVTAWRARLIDEYRSATLFSQFQTLLLWAAVPNDLLGCCSRVVQDELRHVQLCGDLLAALGADPSCEADPEVFGLNVEPEVSLERQVLDFALQYFCLGEQLSAHVIEATARTAGHPVVREVLRRLGSDERFHAEFGWNVLEVVWPHAEDATREEIVADLPHQLSRLEKTFLSYGLEAEDVPIPDDCRQLGSLTIGEHRATFYESVERDLLPRLGKLGLDGRRLWSERAR